MPDSERMVIAMIDAALNASLTRSAVSRDQVLRTLGDVEARVAKPEMADQVAAVVNDAAVSYCRDALVDRGRYLDTLLDIRTLLIGLGWDTRREE